MKFVGLKVFLALAALALWGCSSFTKEKCEAIDWKTMGYEVGERGESVGSQFTKTVSACQKHGIKPNEEAYAQGIEEGRKQYCSASGALTAGQNGWENTGICKNTEEFSKFYKKGKREYLLERISYKESQLKDARVDALAAQSQYVAGGGGVSGGFNHNIVTEKRKRIYEIEDEIRKLDRELMMLGPVE